MAGFAAWPRAEAPRLVNTAEATPAKAVASEPTPTAANSAANSAANVRLRVATTGNEVRYRIREQLMRLPLPNDAIGETGEVTGGLALSDDGRIVVAESKFVVNTASLTSDSDRRDGYVKRRVLEAEQFPTVEFLPTQVRGLPKQLPRSGTHTFDIKGNLTVRGITRPTTWRVTATPGAAEVKGSASTSFTFADFNITQPRVPVVLSVADTIKLEHDFNLSYSR